MSEVPQYLLVLWTHWWAFISGGPFAIDWLVDRYWPAGGKWLNQHISSTNRTRIELVILLFGIFLAGFLAWQEEHEKRVAKTLLDPSSLYQGGFAVASVRRIDVDAAKNEIEFDVVTASRKLDFTKEFEFKDWKLVCSGKEANSMTLGAMVQINYINVICRIQGNR